MEIGNAKQVTDREDEGNTIEINDENDEPQFYPEGASEEDGKPVTITVAGTYSKRFRRAREKRRSKNEKRQGRLSDEEKNRQEVEVAAACIMAWEGFTQGGKPYELTEKNAIDLLLAMPWVYEQVLVAMNDHQGFSTARSTT